MPFNVDQVHGRSDSTDKIESDAAYQFISVLSITEGRMQAMQERRLYWTTNLMRHSED